MRVSCIDEWREKPMVGYQEDILLLDAWDDH